MNNVSLVGRLTKDVDLRYTPNGVAVANFTLAVNRIFKKEGQPDADFIQCQVWQKQAENAANYLKKGSMAGVTGRIETRNFEGQDGKRVYVTEVVANNVQFLEPKSRNEGGQTNGSSGGQNGYTGQNGGPSRNDAFNNPNGQLDISDDDLPF